MLLQKQSERRCRACVRVCLSLTFCVCAVNELQSHINYLRQVRPPAVCCIIAFTFCGAPDSSREGVDAGDERAERAGRLGQRGQQRGGACRAGGDRRADGVERVDIDQRVGGGGGGGDDDDAHDGDVDDERAAD